MHLNVLSACTATHRIKQYYHPWKIEYIPWWRHQMETFSELLALCTGNSPVTGEFHAQRPVTRSFDVFFDLRLNECWVNHREAGYSRRRRAHYDATVMISMLSYTTCLNYIKVLGWWLSKLGSWRIQWTNGHRSRCWKNMDTSDWTQQQVYILKSALLLLVIPRM